MKQLSLVHFVFLSFDFFSFFQRERQVQKEEAQELTEKLDQEWKNIQSLMVKKTPKAESSDKPEDKPKVSIFWKNELIKLYCSVQQFLLISFALFAA